MKSAAWIVVVAACSLGAAGLWHRAAAAPGRLVDGPALPAHDLAGSLSRPRPESPRSFDAPVEIERCAVCRLATESIGKLPAGTFHVESQVTEQGAVLRLVASDPAIRDALWKATLARGELLAALRAGAGPQLCESCLARRETLTQLDISARRIPEGVMLVYSSTNPTVVRQIHTVVRAATDASVQF